MHSFTFSKEALLRIDKILSQYPGDRKASAVLPLLDLAQRECDGWLPTNAMETVGQILEMPFIRVFEVASFYSMFNLKPVGKYQLKICGTTPCCLRGAEDIMNACKKHLGIEKDEMTQDGLFTISEFECLGACVNAPVVQINDDYIEDLTPQKMVEVLDKLKNGENIDIGSQIGRHCSKAVDMEHQEAGESC
jgi:NADH-quinone oxidoreductase E subunit